MTDGKQNSTHYGSQKGRVEKEREREDGDVPHDLFPLAKFHLLNLPESSKIPGNQALKT
jgi:hypothetical protein